MYHLDNTSGVPEMPEPKDTQTISTRWFGESQEQGGISWPGADWFNIVQAELLAIMQASGVSPDKARFDQLSEAIKQYTDKLIFRDRTVWRRLDDTASVLDYGSATEASDATSDAIDYLLSVGGGTLFFPRGKYTFTYTIVKTLSASIKIVLDANAELVMSRDVDLFYFKTTTSGRLLLCGEGIIRAGFVGSEASGVSSSAAVVRFEGTSNVRSFGVEGSLRISKGTMGAFKYGFHLTDVQDPKIIGLHMDGYQQKGEQVGIYITNKNNPSVSWSFANLDFYDVTIGVQIVTAVAPGVEGLKFVDCDFVGVKHGVTYVNTSSYIPPQYEMMGCHVNSYDSCVKLDRLLDVKIIGGLYYRKGITVGGVLQSNGSFFEISNCQDIEINGVSGSITNSNVDVPFIVLDGSAISLAFARIDNNLFWANARKSAFLTLSGNIQKIHFSSGNIKDSEGKWLVEDGVTNPSGAGIVIQEGLQLNPAYDGNLIISYVPYSGGVVSLGASRAPMVSVTGATSGQSITAFSGGRPGKTYNVLCNTAGVKLVHGSGILLKGGGTFTFDSLNTVKKFYCITSSQYQEV
ncbi:hypothetical protein [Klebsiella pneumoniae]|uniref:hypothetical protein n=1 Tax=Klebsiella pneumoniae TaxID=573 RepID=UPI001CDB14B2|nr:hypothetical protein [Klebsiella pneumoniae]